MSHSIVRVVDELAPGERWDQSPMGQPAGWPPRLKTHLDFLLRSDAQIVLFWGPEYIAFYNDSYAPTIGDKHPGALGQSARHHWSELWDDLGPLLDGVRNTGKTFSAKDREFYIERHGYGETVYFDVSYSLVGEKGSAESGVMCVVLETTERVLADRRIRESENRFRALVNATADIVFHMSADWQELYELEGKGILPDLQEREADWLKRFIPPADWHELEREVERARTTETPFHLEHRVALPTGDSGWFRTRAVPIRNDSGDIVEWFGAAASISQLKQQSEHLSLANHELDHRVKNNLAMVQAMALQTFPRNEANATAHEIFLQRLQAIANANRLVTRDGGVSDLGQLAGEALGPHIPSTSRLTCHGPPVELAPKSAFAISLALNELGSNAVKYGAWSNVGGEVFLSWSIEPQQDLPLTIVWIEKGGPPVETPECRGFGGSLIGRGLSAEIEGDVDMQFDPGGVRCIVRAAPSALARN